MSLEKYTLTKSMDKINKNRIEIKENDIFDFFVHPSKQYLILRYSDKYTLLNLKNHTNEQIIKTRVDYKCTVDNMYIYLYKDYLTKNIQFNIKTKLINKLKVEPLSNIYRFWDNVNQIEYITIFYSSASTPKENSKRIIIEKTSGHHLTSLVLVDKKIHTKFPIKKEKYNGNNVKVILSRDQSKILLLRATSSTIYTTTGIIKKYQQISFDKRVKKIRITKDQKYFLIYSENKVEIYQTPECFWLDSEPDILKLNRAFSDLTIYYKE